jgi:hypothetical protein
MIKALWDNLCINMSTSNLDCCAIGSITCVIISLFYLSILVDYVNYSIFLNWFHDQYKKIIDNALKFARATMLDIIKINIT